MSQPPKSVNVSDLPEFENKRHVTIVKLPADGIVKPGDIERVCSVIETHIDAAPDNHNFLLSFKDVQYMSSLFIGRLMGFYKRLSQKNAKLMLCDMHPQLETVIRVSRLERQMTIYPDRAQALTGRTPALIAIMGAGAFAGVCGIGMLAKTLTDTDVSPRQWGATIFLLLNLLTPVDAWVFRRVITRLTPNFQWAIVACIVMATLVALIVGLI